MSADERAFLVLSDGGLDWGIDARAVGAVYAEGDIPQNTIVDFGSLIGVGRLPGVSANGRVLAVSAENGLCFLRTAGNVRLRSVDRSSICELPGAVRRGAVGKVLAGVVFDEGGGSMLVMDVEGLVRLKEGGVQ